MTVSNNFFVPVEAASVAAESAGKGNFAAFVEQIVGGLRRHAIAVAAIIVSLLIASLLVTLFATPQYTAISRIEIAREADKITNVQGLESDRKNQDLEFYQTQYALLSARSVAERVAKRLNVVSSDHLFGMYDMDVDAEVDAKRSLPGKKKAPAAIRLELATDLLLGHVSIRPVPGSSLVDVAYTSPSAELSAQVANLWVDEFQESTLDRRFSSTAEARDFLEGRLGELRKKLEDSQRQLVSYAAKSGIVTLASNRDSEGSTDAAETLRVRNLRALSDALNTATAQRIAAESQAGQAGNANQVALSNIALNSMREKRTEVSAELARQRTVFEPAYPVIQGLQAQLAEIDRSISAEEGRVRNSAQTGYREALAREQQLQQKVNALRSDAMNEQRDSIQYAIFQREVDTNRELYEGLLQRYKEIGVAGVGANNISIVDRSVVPVEPTSPSLPLNLALGLLAGFAAAGAYVFVREQLDQSIRDPQKVAEVFGLPLLGAIPEGEADDFDQSLLDPKAPVSEAYMAVVSNMSFLTATGAPRSVAITSTRPNEGKSTSAFALAMAMARIGKKTVLVDCDLRNPSLHAFLGLSRDAGLSNLLSSGGDFSQLEGLCEATETEGLDFLPAGRVPPNPGALLSSDGLQRVLARLLTRYDVIIVDAPPMLGLADAQLVAKAVEGVIYTIEANGVKTRAIQTALNRLRFAGAQLFGAMVTKLNSSNSSFGYGYGYGYGYSYGDKHVSGGR